MSSKHVRSILPDITMSRKDKIIELALAVSHQKIISHSSPVKSSISIQGSDANTVTVPGIQKQPISTDLNQLWSRPLDYNDFKTVFDFRNEYSNSFNIVRDIDLNIFIKTQQRERHVTRHSLKCHEIFPLSDEDDCDKSKVNMFDDSDDSVKDKDYLLDCSMDSDFDFSTCNEISTTNITLNAEIHNYHETSFKDYHGVQNNRSGVLSDFEKPENQMLDVITEYILPDTSTGDLRDESLPTAPVTKENTNKCISDRPEKETENAESGRKEGEWLNDRPENEIEDAETERNEEEVESPSLLPANGKGFTKSGLPRKRCAFDIPLRERTKQKKESANVKLALKPPCGDKCRKKCMTKFTEEIRTNIHDRYINLSWESRGLFIKGMVEPYIVKTRTKTNSNATKNRNVSYRYHFCVNNEKIEVCQVFFLTTLGYKPTNNRHIHLALNKEVDDQRDKQGSYERKNTLDKDIIKEHIQSFNPTISHYRREHAPNKFYLPSDLNMTMMHQYFTKKYTNIQISLETYRKVVKEMNISFAHLGHEECEQCVLYKSHNECSQESCELCIQYEKHKLRYTQTRQEYQNDKEEFFTDENCIYFSVDLQKVIMLPRMDQFKSAIFCPRIIAFNESFVPLGSSSGTNVPFAVLWNETVSGRNQEDIISAFRSFLVHKRDVKHVVLWVDNCAAQNKNWAFMCFLVNIVNSQLIAAESITVKYFEPGHTFMSADHFHHQVELSLKKKQKVYDFDDFVDAVKLSNSKKNTVKVMTVSDFYFYQDLSSQHKIRNTEPRVYLKNIMAVKAERGQFSLKHKENHVADWKEFDFLQMKIIKNKSFPNVNSKVAFRGVTKDRKERIITELLPLMPETRRDFWLNLPESSRVSNID